MIRMRIGLAVLVLAGGAVGCSSSDQGDAGSASTTSSSVPASSVPTTTQATASVEAEFESGATITHPSDWISYGAGVNGLGLRIPGIADVAVRDATATENLLGSMASEQASLAGAFDAIVLGMGLGDATVGETTITTDDGREMISAPVVFQESDAFLAVTESGDSFGYIWTVALGDSLPQEAIDASLQVLASMAP